MWRFLIALEKSGANPKDYTMVGSPDSSFKSITRSSPASSKRRCSRRRSLSAPRKKGYYKIMDVGAMVEMPGGGLTTMIKRFSPGRGSETCHSCAPVGQGRDQKIQAEDGGADRQASKDGQGSRKRNL